jgi:integrase
MPRLTEAAAKRRKPPAKGQDIIWCSEVRGFGARLTPGARSWIVQLRYRRRSMRLTLGRIGTLPIEGPPERPGARDLAVLALNAARRGEDPKAAIAAVAIDQGPTLGDIWNRYEKAGFPLLSGTGRKRPATIAGDKGRWRCHLSKLKDEPVADIGTGRVRTWLDKIESQGQRDMSLALLKSLLAYAAMHGVKTQPISIKVQPSRKVANYYSAAELIRLDRAAERLSRDRPSLLLPFAAIRLLLHTGARSGEVRSLEWANVDLVSGVARLKRDKTSDSGRDVLLPPTAVAILEALPRRAHSQWVFPARTGKGHIKDLDKTWRLVVTAAGTKYARPHDLRHSFASASITAGNSLYLTGKLLGHTRASTTERYAHLERDTTRLALDRIAESLKPKPAELKIVAA